MTATTKTTHTPGPWCYGRVQKIVGVNSIPGWFIGPDKNARGRPVLDIGQVYLTPSQNEAEQEANAKLIAEAPTLAELLSETQPGGIGQGRWPGWCAEVQAALDRAGIPWRPADRAF